MNVYCDYIYVESALFWSLFPHCFLVHGKPDLCVAPRAALTTALSVVRARQTGQCGPPTRHSHALSLRERLPALLFITQLSRHPHATESRA